jgi:hypothetical protein
LVMSVTIFGIGLLGIYFFLRAYVWNIWMN